MHLRMGLPFVAEQVLEQKPGGFNPIVNGLIGVLDTQDISLRGDTVGLLCQMRHTWERKTLIHHRKTRKITDK